MSVVFFGMFHGLALLPIFLSVFGPPAYSYRHEMEIPRESTIAVITSNEDLKDDPEKRPGDPEQNHSEVRGLHLYTWLWCGCYELQLIKKRKEIELTLPVYQSLVF